MPTLAGAILLSILAGLAAVLALYTLDITLTFLAEHLGIGEALLVMAFFIASGLTFYTIKSKGTAG